MADKPADRPRPEPCIRCGSTLLAPVDETIEELYVYTGKLTWRDPPRLDIDTSEPRTLHGRVCGACTPAAVAWLTAATRRHDRDPSRCDTCEATMRHVEDATRRVPCPWHGTTRWAHELPGGQVFHGRHGDGDPPSSPSSLSDAQLETMLGAARGVIEHGGHMVCHPQSIAAVVAELLEARGRKVRSDDADDADELAQLRARCAERDHEISELRSAVIELADLQMRRRDEVLLVSTYRAVANSTAAPFDREAVERNYSMLTVAKRAPAPPPPPPPPIRSEQRESGAPGWIWLSEAACQAYAAQNPDRVASALAGLERLSNRELALLARVAVACATTPKNSDQQGYGMPLPFTYAGVHPGDLAALIAEVMAFRRGDIR